MGTRKTGSIRSLPSRSNVQYLPSTHSILSSPVVHSSHPPTSNFATSPALQPHTPCPQKGFRGTPGFTQAGLSPLFLKCSSLPQIFPQQYCATHSAPRGVGYHPPRSMARFASGYPLLQDTPAHRPEIPCPALELRPSLQRPSRQPEHVSSELKPRDLPVSLPGLSPRRRHADTYICCSPC